MKILIVNQFFWPDVAATAQLLNDLTRHLGANHEVTVICSGGFYDERQSEEAAPPVKIIRVPGMPYSRSFLGRFLSYALFFVGSLWHELRVSRPDVVVTMTTPPLLAVGGTILKAIRGTRHYIWEMDVFPDVLTSLGALSESGWIARLLAWVETTCRRRSDGIIALGPCMRKRLIDHGIPSRLIHVVENWADGRTILPSAQDHQGPLNIFYSGNLGVSHDLNTITNAIRHFRNDPRFTFTFAGGGVGKKSLERICIAEEIENVSFLPYCSREQMSEHLAQGHIGLVTQLPASLGTVVPSKVYGLMAAGKPILFIGPQQSTPDVLVKRFRCGWQVDPGDVNTLITLLDWLAADRETVMSCGERARAAFERHYDLPTGVANVAAALGLSRAKAEVVSDILTEAVAKK